MSWRASLVAVALAAAVCPAISYGQNQDDGGGGNRRQRNNDGGGGGGGGGRGNFDPAQWQQRRMEQVKEQLDASDEEWKVIEPKLAKIMDAQRQSYGGMMGGRGRGRGGGDGGGNDQAPTTKLGIAAADLRKATQGDASPEDVEKKLTTYRTARAEAQATLEAARKDLKEVLTPKQEAVLVLGNILE